MLSAFRRNTLGKSLRGQENFLEILLERTHQIFGGIVVALAQQSLGWDFAIFSAS
jgi:hypothetical protein